MPRPQKHHPSISLLCLLVFLVAAPWFPSRVLAAEEYKSPGIVALPVFRHQGVVLDYEDLKYNPCDDIIIPSVVETTRLQKPLGQYYLYYAPHNAPGGICMAFADSPAGPWKEHPANPLIRVSRLVP